MKQNRSWTVVGLVAAVAVGILVYRWWNRPPALEYDNLRYIQLLATAVSARNPQWLERVDDAVQQRRAEGQMSDAEFDSLQQIIAMAEGGAWEQADRECFDLAAAQLNRRRSPPDESGHSHDHSHVPHAHTHTESGHPGVTDLGMARH